MNKLNNLKDILARISGTVDAIAIGGCVPHSEAIINLSIEILAARQEVDILNLVEMVESLSSEKKKELLNHWCRSCNEKIDGSDWSGNNYCYQCSPDPRD